MTVVERRHRRRGGHGRRLHAGARARPRDRRARRQRRRLRRPATPATSAASRSCSRRLRAPLRARSAAAWSCRSRVNGVSWWSSSDCGAHLSAETQILPEHDGGAHGGAGHPHLAAADVGDGRRGQHLRRVADAELPRRQRRVDAERHRDERHAGADRANPNPAFGAPVRIPIEADNTTANTNDHFIPGIAADPNTSGATAHLGLFYYNYPVAACVLRRSGRIRRTSATCASGTCRRPTAARRGARRSTSRSMSLARRRAVEPGADGRRLLERPPSSRPARTRATRSRRSRSGSLDTTLNQSMYVPIHGLRSSGAVPVRPRARRTRSRRRRTRRTATPRMKEAAAAPVTTPATTPRPIPATTRTAQRTATGSAITQAAEPHRWSAPWEARRPIRAAGLRLAVPYEHVFV